MGWASASLIFDNVVISLAQARIRHESKVFILQALAKELIDGDWDTYDESLEMFPGEPAVLEAFKNLGLIDEGGN